MKMSTINFIISRGITTSSIKYGKRVFTKFLLYNKKGSKLFKQRRTTIPSSDVPIEKRGVRDTGYKFRDCFVEVNEMIPDIIVPNLNGFKLKPYVSYKCENLYQSKFTAKDLFNIIYKEKIIGDFNNGKLDPSGKSVNPSKEELLNAKEARNIASKAGSDIFTAPLVSLGTLLCDKCK